MESSILRVVGQVAGIGGISLAVFLILFREAIRKKLFPEMTKQQGFRALMVFMILTWLIAIIGIAAWVLVELKSRHSDTATIFTLQSLQEVTARQLIDNLNDTARKLGERTAELNRLKADYQSLQVLHEQLQEEVNSAKAQVDYAHAWLNEAQTGDMQYTPAELQVVKHSLRQLEELHRT